MRDHGYLWCDTQTHQTSCPESMNLFVWIVCESHWSCRMCSNLALTNFGETLRCDDGDAATTNGVCVSGMCQGCPIVTTACDSGTWNMSNGQCSATLPPNGTRCDSETPNPLDVRHSSTQHTMSKMYVLTDVNCLSFALEQLKTSNLALTVSRNAQVRRLQRADDARHL